ncbi:MAG: hypothetical protein WC627_11670 [Legionella sp.]|jgi:serine/threonine protein kinase
MTNQKKDELHDRLQVVLKEIDAHPSFPLANYINKEQFKRQIANLLAQSATNESIFPLRIPKLNPKQRTSHIVQNRHGDFVAVLDTKSKKNDAGKDSTRIIATGSKKRVKVSWRIDVWPPQEYVSSVSYGSQNAALAQKEASTSQEMTTPFHADFMPSAVYEHKTKTVALSLFSPRMQLLQKEMHSLNLVNRFIVAYGLMYAIRFMHLKGKVHGDLNPSNVVLDLFGKDYYRPVVIDFGATEIPGTPAVITPGYESPELFCFFIHKPNVQSHYASYDFETLAQGYARKRRNTKAYGHDVVKGEDLRITYPARAGENHNDFANDVWSLGIILYQLFNKGKQPNFADFQQQSQPKFLKGMLAEQREQRSNMKTAMTQFMQFMCKNSELGPAIQNEIIKALIGISHDADYHAELMNDILSCYPKDVIVQFCRIQPDINPVLKASLLNNYTAMLQALCEKKFDLLEFVTQSMNEPNLLDKTTLIRNLIKHDLALVYMLENVFNSKKSAQQNALKLLRTSGYCMELICIKYIIYDYESIGKDDIYSKRLKILFNEVPGLEYKKIIDFAAQYSDPIFAHTLQVLNENDANIGDILSYIGITAKNRKKLLKKAIEADIDLRPLFDHCLILASQPKFYPLHCEALDLMLKEGYGKSDKKFITTHVSKALRIMMLNTNSIADAMSLLNKLAGPYEKFWGWEDDSGKLFSAFQFTFNELLAYEQQIQSRVFDFCRSQSRTERLKVLNRISKFILGAEIIEQLSTKLDSIFTQSLNQHLSHRGFFSSYLGNKSSLVTKLQKAIDVVSKIEKNTINPVTMGTNTPITDIEFVTANLIQTDTSDPDSETGLQLVNL